MKAPVKSALLALVALLASLCFAPSAGARSVADVAAGEAAAPTPRLARAARWREGRPARVRRLQQRKRRRAAIRKRRQREGRSRPGHPPAPAPTHVEAPASSPAPGAAPAPSPVPPSPEPTPEPEPEPSPEPTPEPEPEASPAPESPPEATPAPLLEAGFENGLAGWNTAGLGEAMPTVVSDIVRTGSRSAKFALSGSQHRSELILGGSGNGSTAGAARFHEGDEYWYGFSFYIEKMVYGRPGAHNLIMQFKSSDSGSPNFGLMLWDHQEHRGLWSHGAGMGGDRYLAPVAERSWHDVAIHFKASGRGEGYYELYLDGNRIDSRSATSMIVPGAPNAYIKDGIYRNGGAIPGASEIRLDAARLGASLASVSG